MENELVISQSPQESNSALTAEEVIARFSSKQHAQKYSAALINTGKDSREKKCIEKLLENLAPGKTILDLPCGTGRMYQFLKQLGFITVSADSSKHMVEIAKANANRSGLMDNDDIFTVCNALQTPFSDGQFDGVLCNRLIHHLNDPLERQKLLKELKRITKGPIVVSFFCSDSWGGFAFFLKHFIKQTTPKDRIPIPLRDFKKDIEKAGLKIKHIAPTRSFISKQWYILLEK